MTAFFSFFFSETSANLKTLSLSQQTGTSRGRVKLMVGRETDKEGRGGGGGQATRSLFRKTLEATGNSTLHFSCQTPAGLMACSQRVVRQRERRGRARDVEAVPIKMEAVTTLEATLHSSQK